MPAPYPISWASPYDLFVTTLGTTAAAAGLDRSHSIGHVLLKVRCGTTEPFYLSQTGANDAAGAQFLELDGKRANLMFKTYGDGKLYTDAEARTDWDDSVKRQVELGAAGRYESDPAKLRDKDLQDAKPLQRLIKVDIDTLIGKLKALGKVNRHHFARATIRINDAQCKAIRDWRDAYVASGGQKRYALHRAPWVMDANGKYDGGACGSVSFAGAFFATGLDYKKAAARVIEHPQLGTGRLTASIARDGRKLDGWYLLHKQAYNVPGSVACAAAAGKCTAAAAPWLGPLYDKWNGPEDAAGLFGIRWLPLGGIGGGPAMLVNTTTVPVVAFEPEKFYQEILARWNQANHDAFAHPGWCKIDGVVPTIVLDGRAGPDGKDRAGRAGLKGGFDNPEVNLF